MDDDPNAVLEAVGPRLRRIRRDREVTLSELATATGISESTLSRLETGRLRPTLEQLLPLARFHGVTLDELVDAPPTGDPRVHIRPVRRSGTVIMPLTRRAGGIQAYKVILPARRAGRKPPQPDLRSHEGYEWLYVMSGRVRLVLGSQDLTLVPGEAAEFDTHVPHWTSNADATPTELLMLMGPQGERTHLAVRRP
jgi:transcriptional regulator with XRE-family HTH domain